MSGAAPAVAGLAAVALVAVAIAASGCGYRAIYGRDVGERLHVVLARTDIVDVVASDEVALGIRDTLAREGALAAGDGFPRVEVEVLRRDEVSEGIVAGTTPSGARVPVARAVEIGLVARAWIVRTPGAAPERDTGDLRAYDVVAASASNEARAAENGLFEADDARRAVGRRLGRRIGERLLGHAVAPDEGPIRE